MLQTTIRTTVSTTPKSGSPIRVTPLRSSTKTGKRYERSAQVQIEIRQMLSLPESEWVTRAGDIQNETLVFLIRRTHCKNDGICGELLQKLQTRIATYARRFTQNLNGIDEEDLLLKLEIKIIELVLTEESSRKRDFLEVAFAQATNRLALDLLKQRDNSTEGHVEELMGDAADEHGAEALDRAIEFVADTRPSPEKALVDLLEENRRYELLLKACCAVDDRRGLEAVLRHYGDGIPITSKERGKRTLKREFRKDPRQIKYWISTAPAQMRAGVGIT